MPGITSSGALTSGTQRFAGKKVFIQDAINARGVLTGPVILQETDSEFQTADCGGVNRNWTLPPNDNQGLRYYISNIGSVGSIKILDAAGNSLGTIPPVTSGFVSCTIVNAIAGWQFTSAEAEIALQLRALILTVYLNGGIITPGLLEANAKAEGCTYTALQFALAKA